jgi:ADP-heptose:LPS heptosyltransferase
LQFAALAERADVVVANDSGPRHLAAAVGTATASIYWFGNLINAGPLDRGRHRVQLSWTTQCPVCGRDCTQVGWTSPRCEHDVSFVADVPTAPVLADAMELLSASLSGQRQ